MRGFAETAVMMAALLAATAWSTGSAAASMADWVGNTVRAATDLTRLPTGKGKVARSPTVRSVCSCQQSFNRGGAFTDGPWLCADSTKSGFEKALHSLSGWG